MLFSEKTQAFYEESLEYTNLPEDVVAITLIQWEEILSKINIGYYLFFTNSEVASSSLIRPSIYHVYDKSNDTWTLTVEQETLYTAALKKDKLRSAQSLYKDVSDQLSEIVATLEDEDYSQKTEEELQSLKAVYTKQRISLRAYLKTDGTDAIPSLTTT